MDVPSTDCVLVCCDGAGPRYTQTLQTEAAVSEASSPLEDTLLAGTMRELLPINPTDFVVSPATRKGAVKACQVG